MVRLQQRLLSGAVAVRLKSPVKYALFGNTTNRWQPLKNTLFSSNAPCIVIRGKGYRLEISS